MSRRKKSRRGRLRQKKRRLALLQQTNEEKVVRQYTKTNPHHQRKIEAQAAKKGLIGKLNGDKQMKPEMPKVTRNLQLPTVEKEAACKLPKWYMRFPFLKEFSPLIKDMEIGYGMTISDEWIFCDTDIRNLTTEDKQTHIRSFESALRTMLRSDFNEKKFSINVLSSDKGSLYKKVKGRGYILKKPDLFKGYRFTRLSANASEAENDPITTMAESRKMENGANDEKWSVKLDNAAKEYIEDAAYHARVSMRKYLHNLIDADMRRSTH